MSLIVTPMSAGMGAYVEGVDLSQPLSNEVTSQLRNLWLEHLVIVIRGQELSSEQYLQFAQRWGQPVAYPFLKGLDGFDVITPVLKKESEKVNFGGIWHTDTAYQDRPPMATMLLAKQLPSIGGDTLFSNQYLAYEGLSEGLKSALKGVRAVFRSDKKRVSQTRQARIDETGRDVDKDWLQGIHPVFRTHPETGKKALYVNPAHTTQFEGWTEQESEGLLDMLYRHQIREEYQCRLQWKYGDLAIWDNRCAMHYPINDYHGQRRLLHRITLAGDIPE
ncbi:MAG: taurine dioxygenase [Alphaproteobacteria bacterium]|nr:taurine dioxygenase [Alphaproteobacteria bacterium]